MGYKNQKTKTQQQKNKKCNQIPRDVRTNDKNRPHLYLFLHLLGICFWAGSLAGNSLTTSP